MKMERLSITIPADCAKTIRGLAERDNRSLSSVIRAALKAYMSGKVATAVKDTNVAILEAKIASLQQRIKDKDEIMKAKDKTIEALELFIKLEPEEPRKEVKTDTSEREDINVLYDRKREDSL